ncbi:MAG: DUF4019 domain-containing protein [Planctomycetota bacterium]
MNKPVALVLLVVLAASFGCAAKGNPQAEQAARKAADDWLKLIDDENYAQSWDDSSSYFKAAITQDEWAKTSQAVRKPLGKVVSRSLKSSAYRTELPGAPDGQYVILQYTTSFENKKSAGETVTPMLDTDGSWRVSGYYIR